ncbi:MAG: response regulator [Polyangiales bacterium]
MPEEPETTVLIVDDDEDILFMADRYLSSRGFRVITSSTPREVPRLLRRESPDVLVLDLMMPDIDGAELARFARRSVPVVFYSAADEGNLEHLTSMHPHAHIVNKGGPLSLLAETIRTAIALGVRVSMKSASEAPSS